nr:MAG TPA: hypothetical protein [Caudoviricetes sp.]
MKLTETNKWCISADGEFFSDVYDSKEEAIESIKDNYKYDGGYIGRCVDIRFVEQDISDFEISYRLRDSLYDEIGEIVEDWDFTDEQHEEISQIVAKAVIDYINKNNLQPRCYKVIDIEFIEVGDQE